MPAYVAAGTMLLPAFADGRGGGRAADVGSPAQRGTALAAAAYRTSGGQAIAAATRSKRHSDALRAKALVWARQRHVTLPPWSRPRFSTSSVAGGTLPFRWRAPG